MFTALKDIDRVRRLCEAASDGRGFQVRVTCTPLDTGSSAPAPGVILLMEAADGRD
jgi:hypothetical protein